MAHPDHWIDQQMLRRYAELAQDYKYHAIITGYPGEWRISLNALDPDGVKDHDAIVIKNIFVFLYNGLYTHYRTQL